MAHAVLGRVDENRMMMVWMRHSDVLGRFRAFVKQRLELTCNHCHVEWPTTAAWRAATELLAQEKRVEYGQTWERRRCKCGFERTLPI